MLLLYVAPPSPPAPLSIKATLVANVWREVTNKDGVCQYPASTSRQEASEHYGHGSDSRRKYKFLSSLHRRRIWEVRVLIQVPQEARADNRRLSVKPLPLTTGLTGLTSLCVWVIQWGQILCEPVAFSPSGSSVHGILPDKNTGVGCHFLLQGTSPTQGWNLQLLYYRQTLHSESRGKPFCLH